MRKELVLWRLGVPGEPSQDALQRLLIGMDELRARLNPAVYPYLELSDEGHLSFNVPSPLGSWEILAFPFGLGELPGPALAVSFSHRPREARGPVLEALVKAVPSGADWIIFAAFSSREEILAAYAQDRLPPLHVVVGEEQVRSAHEQVELLTYLGVYLSGAALTVQEAERSIRQVLAAFKQSPRP